MTDNTEAKAARCRPDPASAGLPSIAVLEGWFDVRRVSVEIGGRHTERLMVDHPSGSAVLPFDPVRRTAVVVSQDRTAVRYCGGEPLLEAIAGVAPDGFEPAARREALEEAGLKLRDLEAVGAVWVSPETSTETIHLYLARYDADDRVCAGGGLAAEGESLRVIERPIADLWRTITEAPMADAKTLLLFQSLRTRRPDLFD